jgi:hypothetical protein
LQRGIQITDKTALKIRFDVVNILDKIYELRDGSGIGVGAPQFGPDALKQVQKTL